MKPGMVSTRCYPNLLNLLFWLYSLWQQPLSFLKARGMCECVWMGIYILGVIGNSHVFLCLYSLGKAALWKTDRTLIQRSCDTNSSILCLHWVLLDNGHCSKSFTWILSCTLTLKNLPGRWREGLGRLPNSSKLHGPVEPGISPPSRRLRYPPATSVVSVSIQ